MEQTRKELFTLIEALYFQEIKHMREAKINDGSDEESKQWKKLR